MGLGAQLLVAIGAVCLSGLSCAKGQPRLHPTASLADTTSAGRAFEHLHVAWVRNDVRERADLRRDLEAFTEVFPKDGLTPLVRVYWVLSLMDTPTDWTQAERRLESMEPPPLGAAHDLYLVAVAKLRRYRHQPEAAFELLRPLVGKVVDARARALLQEELTFDALEAREPYEAVAYMDAWLRGASEEDRQASEAKVAVALSAVPEAALRGSLEAMRASGKGGESHGYGLAIQRLVGERLGQIAVERGDASLARWLLDPEVGDPLLGEELSGALGQLATSRRGIGSVAGRTVGLVLPTSSADLRDEVADVLRGVLWALEIGKGGTDSRQEGDAPIRLVTRDDGGDAARLRAGMEEVAGEGASVIITALDADSAAEAMEWARSSSLNVIVLAAPGEKHAAKDAGAGVPSDFSVGEDWTSELGVLAEALGSTALKTARIATLADTEAASSIARIAALPGSVWSAPLSCDVTPTSAGDSRFPLDTWERAGVHRWLVAGSSACADDLVRGLRRRPRSGGGVIALSLEGSETDERPSPGIRLVSATAGIVPLSKANPTDPRVLDARAMVARTGAPEGWWTALGHDAAILARRALMTLPPDTTADHDEIARRRALVRRGLSEARAPLWTSEHEGFESTRALARTIRVIDLVH